MRVVIATIAPNITLPIWARLFKRSILPTVDKCIFRIGSPIAEMRDLARNVLGDFAELDIREGFQSHGVALTELFKDLSGEVDALVIEDDCFVTCVDEYIDGIWHLIHNVGGVVGSRLSKMLMRDPPRFFDTYGDGLYPNMMFANVQVLRNNTDMDFTSRNCGDVGDAIGCQLHARGIHVTEEAHLPQCRLSMYCGTDQVDPDKWVGPWLHVGEMSPPPRMAHGVGNVRPGYYQAMAAYAVALETGEVHDGEMADLMRYHVSVSEDPANWPENRETYEKCKGLMRRVYR